MLSTYEGCSHCGSPDSEDRLDQSDDGVPGIYSTYPVCADCGEEWEEAECCNECLLPMSQCECLRCGECGHLFDDCECGSEEEQDAKEVKAMQEETLPMVMNVKDVANALGVSESTARNVMRRDDFPSFPVTPSMRRVYREKFIEWLNRQAG